MATPLNPVITMTATQGGEGSTSRKSDRREPSTA